MDLENNKYVEALKNVIDPELKVDIVNLGLIYGIEIDDHKICKVTMTLTIMGCPLSAYLYNAINEQLCQFDEIFDVAVNLVWSPAWSVEKMSREARLQLGVH